MVKQSQHKTHSSQSHIPSLLPIQGKTRKKNKSKSKRGEKKKTSADVYIQENELAGKEENTAET
jgi:hypothetical protein